MDSPSKHKYLFLILGVLFLYGLYSVIYLPELGPGMFAPLEKTFWLFGLSGMAFAFLWMCGVFCLYQWRKTNMFSCLIWGLSFIVYSVTFIGLMLASFGIVNTKQPETFFIFRQSMIIWAAGIYYGLSIMITENKFFTKGISLLILVSGYLWFIHGLLFVKNIEYTMYGFLSFLFVPVSFLFGYLFVKYSKMVVGSGMKWIAAGMFLMGIAYMAWAPWHKNFIYALWFFVYDIALSLIFLGLTHLPYDRLKLVKHPLSSPV